MGEGRSHSDTSMWKQAGVKAKYIVTRLDGSSGPGGKHAHCPLFVLDLEHDPWADAAIKAIIEHCSPYAPLLAGDLRKWLQQRVWPLQSGGVSVDEASRMINQEKARAET